MGLFLGPIISGAIAQRTSWRWFFWACTIAQGVNFLCICVLFPETRKLLPPTTPVTGSSSIRRSGEQTGSEEAEKAGDGPQMDIQVENAASLSDLEQVKRRAAEPEAVQHLPDA